MKKIALLFAVTMLALMGLLVSVPTSAAGPNLIANPSVETNTNNIPSSWANTKTGSNTTTFSYLATGHTGAHSLRVNMTNRSSGNAKWFPTAVNVLPNTTYTFSDWYQSNVTSRVQGVITATNGNVTNLSAVDVASSAAWKQYTMTITTPANAKTLTINHLINRVGQLTTDDFDLQAPVIVAPNVTITAPINGSTVAGTQTVSASASGGSYAVKNVQFKLDGVNLGAADTTAPYTASWNTNNSTAGTHTLSAVVTNANNITATSANVAVTVNNPTAPTVQVTAPVANATVSGSAVPVTANASGGNQTLTSVQFKLDGANLGSADTVAPYGLNWNTTGVTNGNHVLSAVATNQANLTATATNVTVTVNNVVAPPPPPPTQGTNLIPNASLETANGTAPASWLSSGWGTNTPTFTYQNTGHTGSRSVKVQVAGYTNGAANWYYADVPVTAGKSYKYENWYQSNVDTEVDAEVVMTDGTIQYYWLGTVPANTNWTKFSTTFTVPSGAKTMAIYQLLAKNGYIVSDDYSLAEYTPTPFNRGLVSVTLDDGWSNQYTNAVPVLNNLGLKATYYIISGSLTDQPDYMSISQIQSLQNAGNEIASHSITHSDMTTLSQANMINEFSQSKTTLQNTFGVTINNWAYPFGAYNANTITVGQQYYRSQRTVVGGLNTKDTFNITALKIQEVDSNISQAQVQGWINAAIAQHSWLILVFHEVANTPIDPTDALYTTKPSDFTAEMNYLKNSGVGVVTVNQALDELVPQL